MVNSQMAKTWLTCGDDGIAAVGALKAAPFDVSFVIALPIFATEYTAVICPLIPTLLL